MSSILLERSNHGVTHLILNKPEKYNAFDAELIDEFSQHIKQLSEDDKTRLLIITGKGNHFCAGADLSWMRNMAKSSSEGNRYDARQFALLLHAIYSFPKPTIALVQGMSFGGGLGLIACCDIAIAADNAGFCFSEAKIGLTPSVISPYIIEAIGARAARYYFLTAERFNAEIAYKIGLIHQVVSLDQLQSQGDMLAHTILKNSPHALSEAKKLIYQVAHEKISEKILRWSAEHLAEMRESKEGQEGLAAFLEKREARW